VICYTSTFVSCRLHITVQLLLIGLFLSHQIIFKIVLAITNKDNSPGSVFCVLCNRQIKYKINHTVNYVNVETFHIYRYILSLIFRWRLLQICERIVLNGCWRKIQSKPKLRYYILYCTHTINYIYIYMYARSMDVACVCDNSIWL
jgi:hypothetical protein